MTDAERKELLRGHRAIAVGADARREEVAVLGDREALRDFQRRPETIRRARRRAVRRANDDVPRERIFTPHEVECFVEPLGRHAPRDERAGREIRRHQRLPNTTDRSRSEHRAQSIEYRVDGQLRQARDLSERIDEKAGNAIFGNGENPCVDRIADLSGGARCG